MVGMAIYLVAWFIPYISLLVYVYLNRADSAEFGFSRREDERRNPTEDGVRSSRRRSVKKVENVKAEFFDMTLQKDGSYELDEERRM